MGNTSGLQRSGGLSVKVIAPVLTEVAEEFFPGVFDVESDEYGLKLLWRHPRKGHFNVALDWCQSTGARVGGNHLRAGYLGYWVQIVLENETALRIKGNVRIFDDGIGKSWAAVHNKYPTFWSYIRVTFGGHTGGWEDFVKNCRMLSHLKTSLLTNRDLLISLDSIPEWVWDESLGVPEREAWHIELYPEDD